jgi:hypothetical protein
MIDLRRHRQRSEPLGVERPPTIGEPAEHQHELVDRRGVEPRDPPGRAFDAWNVI